MTTDVDSFLDRLRDLLDDVEKESRAVHESFPNMTPEQCVVLAATNMHATTAAATAAARETAHARTRPSVALDERTIAGLSERARRVFERTVEQAKEQKYSLSGTAPEAFNDTPTPRSHVVIFAASPRHAQRFAEDVLKPLGVDAYTCVTSDDQQYSVKGLHRDNPFYVIHPAAHVSARDTIAYMRARGHRELQPPTRW